MNLGPARDMGRGGSFTFRADCLDGPCLLITHSCPCVVLEITGDHSTPKYFYLFVPFLYFLVVSY